MRFVMMRLLRFSLASTLCSPPYAQTAIGSASASASPAPSPSLEQRVSDLEAYINNSARGADAANAQEGSKVPGPGPGHNAWLMTSTLLVLFMTLPGLALFY